MGTSLGRTELMTVWFMPYLPKQTNKQTNDRSAT